MVTGHMTLAVLYLFTFLMATLEQFSMPIVSAAIPNLVRRESLVAANGLLETGKAVGGIAAPALGGMLLIWLPIGALLIVNASTFAVNAALLAGVSQSLKSSRGPKAGSIREDFAAGVAFLRRRRDLVLLIVILSLANMAVAPVGVLVPAAVKKDFGLGASQVGIAMSVFALGVLFSSQLLAWIRRVGSEALVLLVGLLALGAGQLLFGLTSRFALALGGSFIAGAAIIVVTVMGQTLFQRIVPDEVLGRVLSIRRALMTVLRPIGLLGGAAIADGSRPQIAIVAASSVIVAVALAGLASGALRHMGQRDAQLGAAPDPSQA